MDRYWEYMRAKVCRKCIDGDGKGNCRLSVNESCSLKTFFPEIISVVTRSQAETYEECVQSLRETICIQCQHQRDDRTCEKRAMLECALDRYYPLVIEIIETVQREANDNFQEFQAFQGA
jgi:hypothetical protein